nr:hypothetical protein [Tepidiforma sp.]
MPWSWRPRRSSSAARRATSAGAWTKERPTRSAKRGGDVEAGDVVGREGGQREGDAGEVEPLFGTEAAAPADRCFEEDFDPGFGDGDDRAYELAVVDGDRVTWPDDAKGLGVAAGERRDVLGGRLRERVGVAEEPEAVTCAEAELAGEGPDAQAGAGEVEEDVAAPRRGRALAFEFELGVADCIGEGLPVGRAAVGGVDAGDVHAGAKEFDAVEHRVGDGVVEGDHDAGCPAGPRPAEEADRALFLEAEGLVAGGNEGAGRRAGQPGADLFERIEDVRLEAAERAEAEVGKRNLDVGDIAAAEGAVGEEVGGAGCGVAGEPWGDGCGSTKGKLLEFFQAAKEMRALHPGDR